MYHLHLFVPCVKWPSEVIVYVHGGLRSEGHEEITDNTHGYVVVKRENSGLSRGIRKK